MHKAPNRLLIANRGEIAIRVARAARELGIATVGVHADDEKNALHLRHVERALPLGGVGARAYLDAKRLVALALEAGCDALHPGYGFLSESPELARACEAAGVHFVGPRPETLALFGDKVQARALAHALGVPVPRGATLTNGLPEAEAFFASLSGAPLIVKAVAGGGGRGMRVVHTHAELAEALKRASSEAEAAFGNGAVYVEELMPRARHVEVQIVGDGTGAVVHLHERECSLQRRHQKLVEVAPSPSLTAVERELLCAHATRLAAHVSYLSLGTFEFLVGPRWAVFIEANPRLQVEHPVTEAVLGIDLVQTQLQIAGGATLSALGLTQAAIPAPRGHAIELRINLEAMSADGDVHPSSGEITRYELPQGPGVRVDGAGFVGYAPSPGFDTLLTKIIVHAPHGGYAVAVHKAQRALEELLIDGVATNRALLSCLLADEAVLKNAVYTTYLEEQLPRYLAALGVPEARVDRADGRVVSAPMFGRVLSVLVAPGDVVARGAEVAVLEAMKMESAVLAASAGRVREVCVRVGDTVRDGAPVIILEPHGEESAAEAVSGNGEVTRADLTDLARLKAALLDDARPDAVQKRRKAGQRTARENIQDLCDDGSFVEYGALAIAAQRNRRSLEELRKVSPADGLIAGLCTVNAPEFGAEAARALVVSYDYTVFAGTQGAANHKKQDRLFKLAEEWAIPTVLFAEGGGGRPGDTDMAMRSMLDLDTFASFARLSGRVPTVGIVSGRCFAGNAALLGCADVIIATENANIGMGGPVMIEGAGLGSFAPEEVGPIAVQSANGVVDVRVANEAEAVQVAKRYLGYFQGRSSNTAHADPALLRTLVPENRKRVYDVRVVIHTLFDSDSVLELRREFGRGMVTALARIGGRPIGVIANDPAFLAGAVDAEAADKAARFMRLCNAHGLPLVSLLDTPGFMVGPVAEQTALVRRVSRMLVTAAQLRVPYFTIVLRKAYGLGAMAMSAGSLHAPVFSVAWPTGEFGAMGLEGAVWLAARKELEKIADPAQRETVLRSMTDVLRAQGKASNIASHLEIDDVIDPADTRTWLLRGLESVPRHKPSREPGPFIDTW